MQESRLFKIVYYLLERGHATAAELAEEFEVSVRTIYRDADALSGAGIPIYTEKGRKGGLYLLPDFVMDRVVLSEEEKQKILDGLQTMSVVDDAREREILFSKLSAIFKTKEQNWCEVDFSRWGDKGRDNEIFGMLKQAVIDRRIVRIIYINSLGEQSVRRVQPLKLLYKSRAWYLKAFCMEKQNLRLFKLNRIVELKVLEETFEFCDSSAPPASAIYAGEPPTAAYRQIQLRFSEKMAYRVYDEFEPEDICRQSNGEFLVSAEMPEDEWLIGFLLSFGAEVEVIEPKYLREILAERAREILKKNKI